MAAKRKRSPTLAIVLLVIVTALAVRSLWVSEAVRWRSVEGDGRSVIRTTLSLRSARLGLAFGYEQSIVSMRDPRLVEAALASPGLSYAAEPLPDVTSTWRSIGLGHSSTVDERPESFRNTVELAIPLWGIALLLAIGPVRWLIARRAARAKESAATEVAPDTSNTGRRPNVRFAVIGLIVGMVIGAIGVALFVAFRGQSGEVATTSPAADATEEQAPIHPIVGMWRVGIGGLRATYRFANDGSFVLTFTGMPYRASANPGAQHDAGGSWRANGKELVLDNEWSNTPLTVVGERETATIVSLKPDRLELEHTDATGRPERLSFERTYPFVKGKTDDPALVGRWKSPQFTLDLKAGGDVVMSYGSRNAKPRGGAWSCRGKRLVLYMDPPYVKSAARRAVDPRLTEPREEEYEVRSVDALRMILHRVGNPPSEHLTFMRSDVVGATPVPPARPAAPR